MVESRFGPLHVISRLAGPLLKFSYIMYTSTRSRTTSFVSVSLARLIRVRTHGVELFCDGQARPDAIEHRHGSTTTPATRGS